VSVRILRPQGARRPLAVILYLHGAGWVFGNHHTHDRLIRELAVGAQAAVVFPNYSRSPEAKYPTAIQECYAVARWVAEHGKERGLDTSRIAIAGDSVGGNMSAAVTLLAKQRGGPAFRQQMLFYPVTDANFDTESYHRFATGYYLRRDGMQWSWDQYTTDPAQRAEPTASPLCASLEQLAGLPPALVITAEADVVRDEGEAYADKLRHAGVPVTADRFPRHHPRLRYAQRPRRHLRRPGRHHPGHRHLASGVVRQDLRLRLLGPFRPLRQRHHVGCEGGRRVSVRLADSLLGEMVKLPLRAGAVDRSVWPIAAPLARVAQLLRVDLADVIKAAERVAPYITADGRRLWSVKLIERAIDPNAPGWLRRRSGAPPKTPPTLAG
jgi:acetyl esterase/lipase